VKYRILQIGVSGFGGHQCVFEFKKTILAEPGILDYPARPVLIRFGSEAMAIAALKNESAVKADQNYTSIYRVVNTHSPEKKRKKCLFYGKNHP
jgi:hypothetical protein